MSIAINLLPDVRQARIRAQHLRHLITGIAVAVWIVVGIIVGGLFLGIGTQKLVLSSLNNKITADTSQIQGTPGFISALSAQQTLQDLPGLYTGRPSFAKLMPLLTATMPPSLTISDVAIDDTGALTFSAVAPSPQVVDQFYEALKASGAGSTDGPNFSDITITSVSTGNSGTSVSISVTATVASGALHG